MWALSPKVVHHSFWANNGGRSHGLHLPLESQRIHQSEIRKELNVRYDEEGGRTLVDLFFPVQDLTASTPILVFIHGGYWQAMR